jgi:aspartyl-tRNA(Asn)/glutamyl-tRNA(Gln) amidotransferase subunit A
MSGVGSTEPPVSGGGGLPAPGAGNRGVGSTEPPVSGGGGLPAPGAGTVDTLRLTAEEAIGLLARGEASPTELHRAYLDAIEARDPELHAYLTVCGEPDGAGIPIALKDVIGTKGIRTTAGSKILENYVPVYDSTVATRCKDAGLTLLGKTNTDEFAMGSSTENSAYGPTHNPWDLARVPGGSGGGSAAAVAGGLAPWALGSDTGGSIKQPAALCGIVGLRPTYGTVSRYGVVAFASSLDQVGPTTKTVRDCALLYDIVSGRDECDSTTVDVPAVELPTAEDLKGVRIGVPRELNDAEGIEPGVRDSVRAAIDLATELGAEVEECSLPRSVEYGLACYYLVSPAEASSNLARYDGVRFGLRKDGDDFREMVMRTRHDGLGDEPKRRIMIGTYALSAGYFDAYYGKAQQVRTVIKREHDELFERFDCIASPTSPTVAFRIGERTANPLAMYLSDLLTIPSCMAGMPGLSIPCGLSEGLPVGLQLVGPQFAENTLFRVGHALERALGFDTVPERLR